MMIAKKLFYFNSEEVMRSAIAQKILDKTPKDLEIFVRLHADIAVRVHQILEKKGLTQAQLAERLEKQPSEISKWLSGEHNLTLRSLAKLEAELGEPIVLVAESPRFKQYISHNTMANATKAMTHEFVTVKIKSVGIDSYSLAS